MARSSGAVPHRLIRALGSPSQRSRHQGLVPAF